MQINRPRKKAPKFYYGYSIVAVVFIVMFLAQGLYVVFGVFFDSFLNEFGWTRAAISGAYSLCSVFGGALAIVMGYLTDRFGPRLVVTGCGFCLGLGYLLMSQVNSLWQLYLFYGVIIGVGMSGLWVPLLSSIVRWFTGRRSLMTGIAISGLTVGQLIAPLVISRLIAAYEWRNSYIILGITVMVVIVLSAQFLKRSPGLSVLSPDSANERKDREHRADSQDFSLREAFTTLQFWLMFVILFCVGYAAFGILVHVVPHATKLGIPDVTAANILAISGGIGIIGNFVLGGLVGDRFGNRKAFIVGSFLMAAALFWLVPIRGIWMLYLFAVVFGIGIAGAGTSESPLIAGLFGPRSHGLIYGVMSLSWTSGGAVGPVITGYLCDVNGNYQFAFLLCALVSVLAFILLIILKPTRRRGLRI